MVAYAFEKAYKYAKQNNKEDFVLVINILGYNEYPEPTGNQLPYDSISNDVYVSNIKRYIQSYKKICARSVFEAEGADYY